MDKKEAKQKLFEIIKKEQDCTITEDDVKLLCEIVVNNNPYATEDLNIPLKFDYESDNGLACCVTKTAFENVHINYNPNFISSVVKDIVVESNGEKSTWSHFLIDIIITSFHESRHYTQREILEQSFDSKEIKTEIEKNEKAKDIIDSVAKKHPKFTDKKFVESLVKTLKIYYPFNDINNNPTQNIDNIVHIITHGAYLNTGCEQDARNFSYLYAKEFLTAIHKDPETPDYVKKWCKESAEIVIEEIQNELTLNEKYINYSKNVEAISPSFEILLKIRQKLNNATSKASQNVKNSDNSQEEKQTRLDKILESRNEYLKMYEECFDYLFKDVSCKKAIDYYTLAAATPIMHIDSFIDNEKAVVGKDTFLLEYLRKLISIKFSKASETEQQELSKYALKAASYPPIANNPEYAMDLDCAMTEDDELELGINIICSFHKADMSEWDFSYFDENKKSDKKLISKLFNLFDQNYNIPINENDTNIDTAIKVKKNEILKEYLTSHSLISAFERFGYKNQISQIMKREPPISNADKTQLKDSLTDKDKREIDKIMYGEQYVNRNKLENAIMPIDKLVENTPVTL